ncbi:MAG: MoaD/ThiS family protein [Pedobacter sp.]
MTINFLSFGSLTEIVANGQITSIDFSDSDSVKNYLIANYPVIAEKKFIMAVNKSIIQQNTVLNEFDTVAILPPFSGG